MRATRRFANGIEGRHVLMALIGFFGVMLFANGVFVYFALATFSGGDTANPYGKGLHYNETLKAAARQAELGWQTELSYDDKTGRLLVSFLDKGAAPVTGLEIGAMLSRPATDKEDRFVALNEVARGTYAASVALEPGLWVVSIASREAGEGQDAAYRLKRRLFVAERP
jgi:nitrogen fixation protein FixH